MLYIFFFYRFNYSYGFVHELTLSFKQAHSFQFTVYIKLIYVHRAKKKLILSTTIVYIAYVTRSYLSVLLTRNRLSYRFGISKQKKYNKRKRRRTTEQKKEEKKTNTKTMWGSKFVMCLLVIDFVNIIISISCFKRSDASMLKS